ncbi:MAG: YihY/virulence factor BrkB family protein [Chloroflexi bacterium]|nr:YihY/virulence factor BrkB family protein [Chloroflexota bacterium]
MEIISLLRQTGKLWNRSRANRMSAALAYYTVLSLSPLLLIAVTVAGLAYGATAAQSELMNQIRQVGGYQVAEAVENILLNSSRPETGFLASLLSLLILLFGASNVFDQLQEAMNTIWGVPHLEEAGLWKFIKRRLYAVGLVLSVGLLLVALILVSTVLSVISQFVADQLHPSFDLLHWLDLLLSGILLSVIFAFLFKVLPEARVRWRDVWGGGVLTAVLITLSKYLIGLYFGRTSSTSAYGAAGSLAVLLIWVYFSGQIFFLGAAFTKVVSDKRRKQELVISG